MDDKNAPQYGRVPYQIMVDGMLAAMTAAEAKVYLAIAVHCCRKTSWTCRPSLERLAAVSGMHRRGVYRTIKSLERKGAIRRLTGGGRGHATTYELLRNRDKRAPVLNGETGTPVSLNRDKRAPPTKKKKTKRGIGREADASVVVPEADPEPVMGVLMHRLNAVGYADPLVRATLAIDHPVEVAAALDALDVAVAGGKVRSPAGYLDGILKKTLGGNGRPRDETAPLSAAERDRRRERDRAELLKIKAERAKA